MDEIKLFKLLGRIATALEKSAGIEAPAKPTPPVLTEQERRDNAKKNATVVRRGEHAPEWDGKGIPPAGGNVSPAEFWRLGDDQAARMKRPTRSERTS